MQKISSARKLVSVAVLATIPTIANAQQCIQQVNELSYLWTNNLMAPVDSTSGPGTHPNTYSNWLTIGSVTYSNTDINAGGSNTVELINDDYGAIGLWGAAAASSGTTECFVIINNQIFDANTCNQTTLRADSGFIYLNDFYMQNAWTWDGEGRNVVQHEIGHMLGMAHANIFCDSIMRANPSDNWTDELRSWEVNWINNNY